MCLVAIVVLNLHIRCGLLIQGCQQYAALVNTCLLYFLLTYSCFILDPQAEFFFKLRLAGRKLRLIFGLAELSR